MPLFSAVPGQALPAATYNLNVRNQVITTCTSSTRPATPVEGQFIYETNTDAMAFWNGSGWIYAPPVLLYQASGSQAFTANQTSTNITFDTEVVDLGGHGAVGSATITLPAITGLNVVTADLLRSAGAGTVRVVVTSTASGGILMDGVVNNNVEGTRLRLAGLKLLPASDVITFTASEAAAAAATLDFVFSLYRIA